jgi:gamma-glutamylcyclotransferase (GGCT)/AIG2-like uncharacterized protein YtfP
MDWAQMRHRCPSAKFVCVGRLPNYCFAIARHSQLRNCGTANIFAQAGNDVWGVVYQVSDADLVILDGFEDGYRREPVLVQNMNDGNAPVKALVYIAPREFDVPLPNPEYKRLILSGALHWRLPESYCAMLEKIEAGGL